MSEKIPEEEARYLHCRVCVEHMLPSQIEVLTDAGGLILQIWCKRHDMEVAAFELASGLGENSRD